MINIVALQMHYFSLKYVYVVSDLSMKHDMILYEKVNISIKPHFKRMTRIQLLEKLACPFLFL